MDNTMTKLAQIMNSAVKSQGLVLDMLDHFFKATGSLVVEFDGEFKTFASWRSKGIDHLEEMETAIARHWLTLRYRNIPPEQPFRGIIVDSWFQEGKNNQRNVCLAAYLSASDKVRPTAWCVVLPEERGPADEADKAMLEKLVEPVQTIHTMSKGFVEVASQGIMAKALAETSPWGLAIVDLQSQVRFMNAQARSILARNNGITLSDGRVKLARSAADRALQLLIATVLKGEVDEVTDGDGFRVVSVPGSDDKVGYAIEVRPYSPMKDIFREPAALLIITDFDQAKTASGPVLAKVFSLSERESEFAEVFGRGHRLEETARLMQISPNTARVHLQHVLRKTGAQNQVELARVLSRLPYSGTRENS